MAFLDDDAYPMKDWLSRAIPHFSEAWIGAVGGPASTPPAEPELAQLSGRVYANWLVSGSYRYRYAVDRVREIDDFPSCNLLVRASLLREIGGFSTKYWPGEDTILCLEIVKRGKTILYDPRVHVHHHRRRLFLPHLRQIGRYALHRGYFVHKFPETSRRPSYMIPSLFVLGLVIGAIASLCWSVFRLPYALAVLIYALITALFAFHRAPKIWLLTWLGIVSTHVVYGTRFLQGLLSPHMPGEVREFDHPSEQGGQNH